MKVVDLFSGCGGMSLGFQNAGFSINAAFDNWKHAVDVYKDNFDHPIFLKDLSNSDVDNDIARFSPNMIIGGPPCQDFSIAGKRNENGQRANLTRRYAEIIQKIRPEWVVMENVYNITRSKILPETLDILKRSGYGITQLVLDSSYLGVPQARKRFFLVAHLYSEDDFLTEELLSNHSIKPLTVKEYFGNKLDTEYYYMHPRSYQRRAIFSVNEPSATIRGINRPIPQNYVIHSADKSKDISIVRALTTKERSYIQTFPENFQFNGSKTAMELAIGNAVPVKMAEHVANSILRYIESIEVKSNYEKRA
ncbi:DNA cytosine methyltransferase [Pseudocolwellia agarivorans]|uniref:DNA cytosine methyltransferase n=1 Tax=Pseudocolwellia agarivorans TaxID=1911682 RepID=UPI0009869C76|nr:DNA cytosine methyltransferase [Pseudocolwellia agarivorans]